jgi:hypothetical protein
MEGAELAANTANVQHPFASPVPDSSLHAGSIHSSTNIEILQENHSVNEDPTSPLLTNQVSHGISPAGPGAPTTPGTETEQQRPEQALKRQGAC